MIRAAGYIFDFISAIVKIFMLLIFILFLPWLFLWNIQVQEHQIIVTTAGNNFKLGIEILSEEFLKNLTPSSDLSYAVGLITNQTGIDQKGNKTIDILLQKGLKIHTIFSPHHGFDGTLVANAKGSDTCDPKTNIPIINLHGKDGIKKLNKKNISSIDVFIFDLQDVGIRYYGYAITLLEIMYAAANYEKIIVVLDRPNPLGSCMEGAFGYGYANHKNNIESIPWRHGMTIGELARYYNAHILTKPAKLFVVPMQNYNRTFSQSNLIMSSLSPNLTSINSCYGYSFLGLLGEIRPFDVGIGTDKAFQCIMLPETFNFPRKKWKELGSLLEPLGIESIFYRYLSKRKQYYYSGLRLFIRNINNFSAYKTLLTIITFFKQSGISFSLSNYFDKVASAIVLRKLIMEIKNQKEIINELNINIQQFFNKAHTTFLYQPLPQPTMM
ncbi:DUF1343 domain-containing protein [Candidatus Dependentiae bacterium]|nr:MAG: DUF1343 domain-containing protein [Candidatus Dependentiae bacterium]